MARVATKNTYGIETIGGVEVRRLVKAGDPVPDHYEVDGDAVREVDQGSSPAGSVTNAIAQPGEGTSTPSQELSGEELDARAKELNVKGRSQMSADELRQAVAEAEAGGQQ
jgi:hypothetical protein